MKLILSLLCALNIASAAQEDLGTHRIVVLGDSITYAGGWVAHLDAWLASKGNQSEVINLGLPSETASDLTDQEQQETHIKPHGFPRPTISERLDRILDKSKPDWIIACYGMNDGSSLPQNDEGFARFCEAMKTLKSQCEKAGVKRLIFLTPPTHDPGPGKPQSKHDEMLTRFSDWMLTLREHGWEIVDVHGPMSAALQEKRQADPAFRFAKDGVHPGKEGHDLIAAQLITHLSSEQESTAFFQNSPYLKPPLHDLINKRMRIRGSAWLSHTGHKRPKIAAGLPLDQANPQTAELTKQIQAAAPKPGDN